MKIYVVEDSEIIKHRIFRLLATIDDVEIAGSSDDVEEAIINVQNLQPDAVLLDISIGNENGLNMIKKIKNAAPNTRIIMFTNFDFDKYRKMSFEFGADYYLDKSQEFHKLSDLVEDLKKKNSLIEQTETI